MGDWPDKIAGIVITIRKLKDLKSPFGLFAKSKDLCFILVGLNCKKTLGMQVTPYKAIVIVSKYTVIFDFYKQINIFTKKATYI